MKRIMLVLLAGGLSARVASAEPLHLSRSAFADTEATTNCPLAFDVRGIREFAFDMTFAGTQSNSVQLAFGRDADSDRVLSAEETDMTFAWDCGEWVLRGPSGDVARVSAPVTTNTVKDLRWNLLARRRIPRHLSVSENGEPLFAEISECPESWYFDARWNLFRLTVRGVDAPEESVDVRLNVSGYYINVR